VKQVKNVASPDQQSTLSHLSNRERAQPTVQSTLYLAINCDRPTAFAARYRLTGTESLSIGRGSDPRIRLDNVDGRAFAMRAPDPWMSSSHGQLRATPDGWTLEDIGSKNGTMVNGRRIQRACLSDGDVIELGHTFFVFRQAVSRADEQPFFEFPEPAKESSALATLCDPLAAELANAERIAPSAVSVIIQGESGTGKEVVASAIHKLSGRPGSFVAVNCAALAKTLVESELFGYRKGAFSGATEDRPGLIRAADRGTLFLDEVGDLAEAAQASLLRVLQEGEVLPVGATRPIKVDFRLLAATHRDLPALVAQNRFRSDLLSRISGLTVTLPPLRQRREDFGLLIGALLRRHFPERAHQISLSSDAARSLLLYPWPLNVRELEKNLTAGVVLANGKPIGTEHLSRSLRIELDTSAHPPPPAASEPGEEAGLSERDRRRRSEIVDLLRQHGGNITAVARSLGIARTQVQRWIKRFHIDSKSFRR
jgi:transcriptional regulator with GAF, ATPase, and Fis domain